MEKPYRVLLADDEEAITRSTSEIIKNEGWECVCASTGEEASNLLDSDEFDILVADYKMPGNEELELLEKASESPGIPTIIITGFPTMHSAIASLKQEAFDYVTKPLDMNYLLKRMREAIETHRLRLALSQMEKKYRSLTEDIFAVSPFGLIIIDADLNVAWINNTVKNYIGLKNEDAIGKNIQTLIHEQIKHAFENPDDFAENILASYVNETSVNNTEFHIISSEKCRERWIEHRSQPISRGPYANGRIDYYIDITQRMNAEQDKLKVEYQFQESQKLESLGVLAGGIAHDFNNLLSGILGGASLALMDLPQESPACEWLHKIEESTLRAADLCKQMLAYAGKGKLTMQQVDLNRLIKEMDHLLETSVSKMITIETNFSEGLPAIEVDATQTRQVILNLVSNASEAIGHENGVITISTGVKEFSADTIMEYYLGDTISEGTYVYVKISDTGHGMTKDIQDKIFNPFFTTKFTGRGLGLSAVLGIIRSHRGTMTVASHPDSGSSFTAFFPAMAAIATEEPYVATTPKIWQSEGMILVIDDEEIVRNITKSLLSNAGFKVITARDGLEGLDLIKKHADEVNAVLLDLTMPRMSGEEVFHELRRIRPDIPIILISGYNVMDAEKRFPAESLAGFIQKPFKPGELLDKITKVMENPA